MKVIEITDILSQSLYTANNMIPEEGKTIYHADLDRDKIDIFLQNTTQALKAIGINTTDETKIEVITKYNDTENRENGDIIIICNHNTKNIVKLDPITVAAIIIIIIFA